MAAADAARQDGHMTTREVIIGYLRYRMRTLRVDGSGIPALRHLYLDTGNVQSPVVQTVIATVQAYEQDVERIDAMENTFTNANLFGNDAKRMFDEIMDSMFHERRVSWGKLGVAILYTSVLFIRAVRSNRHDRAMEIIDWCTSYFSSRFIDEWVRAKGGWEGINDRADDDDDEEGDRRRMMRGSFQLLMGMMGAAAAAHNFLHK